MANEFPEATARYELERHADGSVFVVNPDPLLCDPVNGNSAVVAKCCSVGEARTIVTQLRAALHPQPEGTK